MKRLLFSLIFIAFASGALYAQDATQAFRLSFMNVNGTARSAALGNAVGALGGDFASLSINPAGSAIYRSTELSFTPSLGYHNADATYEGNLQNDTKYMLNLSEFGLVSSIPINNNDNGLVGLNFGIGYNRLADFNGNYSVGTGNNDATNSLLDNFTYYANKIGTPSNFDAYNEGLAYRTGLIYQNQGESTFHNDLQYDGYHQTLNKTINTSGGIDEYVFNLGANINHRVYFGATIGVQSVYYKESFMHSEVTDQTKVQYLNAFDYAGYNKTTGSGINIKLGVIFRPVDNLRLGVAFHSPTFYDLHDTYDRSMHSNITDANGVTTDYNAIPDNIGEYDYKIQTPLKVILSGCYLFGKSGLISADYEYLDYSTMKLRDGGDGYNFSDENNDISNLYRSTQNIHIGGEYRPLDYVSLRAGIEFIGNPYNSTAYNTTQPNKDFSYTNYSCGIGFRQSSYSLDVTYKLTDSKYYDSLYGSVPNYTSPAAKYKVNNSQILLTLGFKL